MSNTLKTQPSLEARRDLDAESAAELLPWLITDSLDVDEAEAVLSHVDAGLFEDELLKSELVATGEMLWLTDQHVPSLTLAELELGLPLTEMADTVETRQMLQAHIDSCAACRGELAMIREDETEEPAPAPVVDFADARRRRELIRSAPSQPRRHRFAIAAAFAATITGAVLVHSLNERLEDAVTPSNVYAQAVPNAPVAPNPSEESLRTSSPADALFADGFESGDTSQWTFVSN